jgi:hypothetical protein
MLRWRMALLLAAIVPPVFAQQPKDERQVVLAKGFLEASKNYTNCVEEAVTDFVSVEATVYEIADTAESMCEIEYNVMSAAALRLTRHSFPADGTGGWAQIHAREMAQLSRIRAKDLASSYVIKNRR